MEYRIILSGTVTKEYIQEVALDWLLVDPLSFFRQPGVSTNNGFGAGNRGGFDDGFQRGGYNQRADYGTFPRFGQSTSPAWGQPPSPAGGRSSFGPPAPTHPVGPADNNLRGQTQCNVGEFYIAPHIRLYQLSEMGNRQVHTFVLNDRQVLIVQMGSMHAKWVRLRQNWEDTHFMQAGQAVGTPVDQTQWGRLERAMDSGIRQLPAEAMHSLREMVKSLFTWEGFLLIAAVTALFILGGEVALLLMGAIAVYDILMNVLPLLVQFYNAAIKATTEEQIEAAGKLFAQAILRGALDVVDILFAAGAYRRLLVLGGGKLSFRAVIVYLVERVQALIKRMAQAAEKLKQLAEAAKKEKAKVASVVRRLAKYKTKPPFEKNPNHSQAEYERQIQGQQDGLNNMTVEEYLRNSDNYKANGRAASGDYAQQEARKIARQDKVDELIRQGKTPAEAKAEADAWMKTQNALHNPDQIAGGHPDHIEGMGDAGVNKSIGSQWKNKGIAEAMDKHIREEAAKMTPEERRTTKLNIELDH